MPHPLLSTFSCFLLFSSSLLPILCISAFPFFHFFSFLFSFVSFLLTSNFFLSILPSSTSDSSFFFFSALLFHYDFIIFEPLQLFPLWFYRFYLPPSSRASAFKYSTLLMFFLSFEIRFDYFVTFVLF